MILDLPPPLWVPPKPAIIRPAPDLAPPALAMPLTMGMLKPRTGGISFVGYKTATRAQGSTSAVTITLGSGLTGGSRTAVQAGDFVLAAHVLASASDSTLSITNGSTAYTLVGSELYANDDNDTNLRVGYRFMGATPDANTTFPSIGGINDSVVAAVYVFSGVNTTTPLDVAATTATGINSAKPNPAAITPATAGSWIACIGANGTNFASTTTFSNSSLTSFSSVYAMGFIYAAMLGIGLKTDWSSGAFDCPAYTLSGSDSTSASWAAITVALRPA